MVRALASEMIGTRSPDGKAFRVLRLQRPHLWNPGYLQRYMTVVTLGACNVVPLYKEIIFIFLERYSEGE